jgi:uncharacterized protein (DUF2141 family)
MKSASLALLPLLLVAAAPVTPHPSLGKAEAACRPGETGPALLIVINGLKDRVGLVRAELYPNNDSDFLQDDAILINQGKTFRRIDMDVPQSGIVTMCMRIPAAGRYTLSLLHDRNRDLKWNKLSDGLGFGSNPKLGWSKPKAASATIAAGTGLTTVKIVMNYLRGFSYRPLDKP